MQQWSPPCTPVHVCWGSLMQSINVWGCPLPWAWGPAVFCIPLTGWQVAPCPTAVLAPRSVLCLGNAGDQGSVRFRYHLSGQKDHHGATAVSQGQPDTGVVGKGTGMCPCAAGPRGWCWPWAMSGRGRGSCTCLGSAACVAACWGWALLPWGQGYVQIIPVLMDPEG